MRHQTEEAAVPNAEEITRPVVQDEMTAHIRTLFDEITVSEEESGDDYVEKYVVDIGDIELAREHASRYHEVLDGTDTRIEQRNSRIIFTVINPPSLI